MTSPVKKVIPHLNVPTANFQALFCCTLPARLQRGAIPYSRDPSLQCLFLASCMALYLLFSFLILLSVFV